MTYNQALKKFIQEHYEGADRKQLDDDWGVQFAKRRGQFTCATTYFYQSQAQTESLFSELQNFMEYEGFELTSDMSVSHEMNPWPKTSWARLVYEVRKI